MSVLTAENINLKYGEAQILRDVSITALPSAITCILGRNGVGKTSLLKALAGHHPIFSGEISIGDQKLGKWASHKRAKHGLAYVPQGREIFPLLTVEENLKTGFSCLPRVERFIPPEVFELFPVLEEMLGRRGGDLSGGQQQQLAIARALVIRPKVLVLDEPTEGIQPSIIKDIGSAIEFLREKSGMTIILVEQYLDFCRTHADDIYIMDRGKIVHHGPPEDLDKPDVRQYLTI